ncbi:hypothetical protein C5167_007279 [Papaver somniferum]|uniref:17.3 kDa class I heat shock protein-like n=1 Tax=Papaver somniferum TaxID=3469 RepID=UPI000E6FD069|nr:17.3 kDa class I heat shock protein-like [Papaver somniferum]RZC93467.1 hypothetical protein C5167_007279 [Papaver somniferum]
MSIVPSFFGDRKATVFDPFSLADVWNPYKDFPLSNPLHIFNTEFSNDTARFAGTKIDWKETPEAHIFKADLPGLKKEEVKVEVVEEKVLQIKGERNIDKEEKIDKWHRVEHSSGKFMRKFRLPENAKVDQLKASMENGVLTVTIPKQDQVKKTSNAKTIDISS